MYNKPYVSDPFDNGTIETGNALMNHMKEEKGRWEEVITSTNMARNIRKAWKTIRNLSNDPTSSTPEVSANQVAQQLLINGKGTMSTKLTRPVLPSTAEDEESVIYPFNEEAYRQVSFH